MLPSPTESFDYAFWAAEAAESAAQGQHLLDEAIMWRSFYASCAAWEAKGIRFYE
jgi:hypothetical protein